MQAAAAAAASPPSGSTLASSESEVSYQAQLGDPGTTEQSETAVQDASSSQAIELPPALLAALESDSSWILSDSVTQVIGQLQIGCLTHCQDTYQEQDAEQAESIFQSIGTDDPTDSAAGSSNSAVTEIWQIQIGCIFWCLNTVEVQTATPPEGGSVINGGANPAPTPPAPTDPSGTASSAPPDDPPEATNPLPTTDSLPPTDPQTPAGPLPNSAGTADPTTPADPTNVGPAKRVPTGSVVIPAPVRLRGAGAKVTVNATATIVATAMTSATSTVSARGAGLSSASAEVVVVKSSPRRADSDRVVIAATDLRRVADASGFPAAFVESSDHDDQSSLLAALDQPLPLAGLGLVVGLMLALTLLRGWKPRD